MNYIRSLIIIFHVIFTYQPAVMQVDKIFNNNNMADCNLYIPKVLKLEGGFQQFSSDTGNYDSKKRLIGTNHGVSARTMETYYLKYKKWDLTKTDTARFIQLMKNLTIDEAKYICKEMYWDICNADNIKNQSIAELLVDWFWGSGYYGLKWSQGSLKSLNLNITPDYKLTAEEVKVINEYPDQQKLFEFLKQERINYINSICAKNPTYQKEFKKGWLNRINSFIFEA